MKKGIAFIFTTILISLCVCMEAYAQGDYYIDVPVIADVDDVPDTEGIYRIKINNNVSSLKDFSNGIFINNIIDIVITEEDKKAVSEGKTYTLITDIKPIRYDEISVSYPVLSSYAQNYDYVMAIDISMRRLLSNDREGRDIYDVCDINELKKPVTLSFILDNEAVLQKDIVDYSIIRIHNDICEELDTTYYKDMNKFVFDSDRFSTYILFFSVKKQGFIPVPIIPDTKEKTQTSTAIPTLGPASSSTIVNTKKDNTPITVSNNVINNKKVQIKETNNNTQKPKDDTSAKKSKGNVMPNVSENNTQPDDEHTDMGNNKKPNIVKGSLFALPLGITPTEIPDDINYPNENKKTFPWWLIILLMGLIVSSVSIWLYKKRTADEK